MIQYLFFLSLLFAAQFAQAAPPVNIPPELWDDYTLNGQIPVEYWYRDEAYSEPKIYSSAIFDAYIIKALNREEMYYGATDTYLYNALDSLGSTLRGKEIVVIGSVIPWYESILLAYGAHPVVIEYNLIQSNDSRVTYLTPSQYESNPRKFDFILSISSTEHDGLGRYGDPINPNGDLKAMDDFAKMLAPDGKLILAVPVAQDKLVWNVHRVYGPIRLKMLLKGWKTVGSYGFTSQDFLETVGFKQPVFVLATE